MSASKKKSCTAMNKRIPVSSTDDRLARSLSDDEADGSREAQQVFTTLDPVSRLLWSQALRSMH